MDFLRKYVLNNLGLKLLALLISFLIWATYTSEPFVEVGYTVPLEYLNIPPNLEITGDVPTQARVRVRGRAAVLRRISPADLAIPVDLSGAAPGEKSVTLSLSQMALPPSVELVRVTPPEVRLTLAARAAR